MEVVALESFARIILVIFAQMFDVDISMVTDRSAKVASSSAIGVSFGTTGSGLSMSTISGDSTQMTGLSNQEFVNKDLSCTVSSVSANIAEDFSVTLELGATKAEGVAALVTAWKVHPTGTHHRALLRRTTR